MIIGHQKIIEFFGRSVKKGKIAQSYLFSGPESVGKFTLAKIFARGLIENRGDLGSLGDFGNLGGLVDLMVIGPERDEKKGVIKEKDIKIEQIREAQNFLLTYPVQGKYKILIVNNAHRMTEAAQNSLLKILEEPNSTSIIILVAHNHLRILPTLRSRCQRLNFSLVGDNEIEKMLKEKGARDVNEIISLSMGRPGIAVTLSESKEEFAKRLSALADLKKLPSLDINQRLGMAEELSKNITQAVKKLELWAWITRLEGLKKAESEGRPDKEKFKKIEMMEKTLAILQQTNASGRLALENLLLNL